MNSPFNGVLKQVHYGDSTTVPNGPAPAMIAQISQDIAVVAIHETAIEKYGQWSWKRDVLADIIGNPRSRCWHARMSKVFPVPIGLVEIWH